MDENKKKEIIYEEFLKYQSDIHERNQKKIRVGLKVNILLPLVFLIISFMTNGSKLIFLILWIVSLFGISFYLLYIEFTDFKLQEKLREFGIVAEEVEQQALIGDEVKEKLEELKEIDIKKLDVFNDIKELKAELVKDKADKTERKEGEDENEEHS